MPLPTTEVHGDDAATAVVRNGAAISTSGLSTAATTSSYGQVQPPVLSHGSDLQHPRNGGSDPVHAYQDAGTAEVFVVALHVSSGMLVYCDASKLAACSECAGHSPVPSAHGLIS